MKERQSGSGRAFFTLIQQLEFKTLRINVIIYRFSLVVKHLEKEEKFKYSENESMVVDLNQKRNYRNVKKIYLASFYYKV